MSSIFFDGIRKLDVSTANGIEIVEQEVMNGSTTVMGSEAVVESVNPKNCDKVLKKSIFPPQKKVKSDRNPKEENKPGCCSHAKHFFLTQFQNFLKSKAPTYLLLTAYIVICLLGNIVTGIILVKHHLASQDEVEGRNNLTQDIFAQIESRNNETSTIVNSELDFDIAEDTLDQQLLYLNISNATVSQFRVFLLLNSRFKILLRICCSIIIHVV